MQKIHHLLLGLLLCTTASACAAPGTPVPVVWDHAPERLILEYSAMCGLITPNEGMNAIPTRVWGDGRVVWVETKTYATRQVLVGQLSEDELRALLGELLNTYRALNWAQSYVPTNPVMDGCVESLKINLDGTVHTTNVSTDATPPAGFAAFRTRLTAGAGTHGAPLAAPQRAHLIALPYPEAVPDAQAWPADAGFTLAEATEAGHMVEGPLAAFVWDTLNADLYTVFSSDGKYYQLVLYVPGVTQGTPPIP